MQEEKQKQGLDPAWYISACKAVGPRLGSAKTRASGMNPVVGPTGKSFLDRASSNGSLRKGEMCLGWGGSHHRLQGWPRRALWPDKPA